VEHRFEAEYLSHRTGRLLREERASNSEVWEAAAPGIAIYGPGLRYPPGLLRASFRLRVETPSSGEVAVLRVTADGGRAVLAEHRVDAAELGTSGAFVAVALPQVVLDQEQVLEFTAETVGGAKVGFDLVQVSYTSGVWWGEPVLVGTGRSIKKAPPALFSGLL
jgi:hypothetical protein